MQNAVSRLLVAAGLSLVLMLTSCEEGLDLGSIEVGADNTVSWEDAVKIVTHGKVETVFQKHNLDVSITMTNGTRYRTTEPRIDEVMRVIDAAGKKGKIGIMTE